MPMLTMTSLEAQTQFGTLIDSSQREPIIITRRGRPVSVVTAYQDYQQGGKGFPYPIAKMISETYPLRGQEASDAMRKHLSTMSKLAQEEGLTEDAINRMLNEED
jgi:prevent-host-death family protein